jgi:hypothetical protein
MMDMNAKPFLVIAVTVALAFTALTAYGAEESLLPVFGPGGAEFTIKAKDDNKTKGWLPKDWVDNSEWAAVSATYSKLTDPPKEGVAAVRIKVEKVDEGQLQLTTWTKPTFKKGVKYVITGWIRSADNSGLKVGVRQPAEPYEFYAEQDLTADKEWKPFTFDFSFSEDKEGFVMFTKQDTGTVDLAGLVVSEKK